jgi:spore coat polysaccharide biosynthesis protein SpsF
MILCILQARVGSSRLPGKVLMPILGVPMLLRQIERVRLSARIERLLVATSKDVSDNSIEVLCRDNLVQCFRGELDDVLDRFYQAARVHNPHHVVRLTGDCPLCDPVIIDRVVEFHLIGGFDYTSNTIRPTFPDGLDVEVFRFNCLQQAWQDAKLPSQREHVTSFIHQQPDRFTLGNFSCDADLSSLRWTVDEPLDFELVSRIYETLYPINPNFDMQAILDLLDRMPELKSLNTSYRRNEGYLKSLARDRQYFTSNGTD